MKNIIEFNGNLHKLNINGRLLRGWILILDDDENEYLMRRDIAFSLKRKWNLYRTDILLKNYMINSENTKNKKINNFLIIILSSTLGANLFRHFIPKNYLIGSVNYPFNIITAIINISIIILFVLLFLATVSSWRYIKMKRIVKNLGGQLTKVGKISTKNPIRKLPNGMEFW